MSEYLDSAGLALYDGQIKAYIDSVSGNSTGVRIVTLTSVPTSSTTTYTIGSTTYNFKVGDEVKANGQYYKLYNLVTEGNTTTAVWNTLGTTYSVMGASGSTHASGLVPDTPSTAGTSKFLREDGTWAEPEGGGYTPTLNAAPTSSTTTYTKDGQTKDFIIGQFCRVADATMDTGYKFYQLADLNNGVAAWQELGTPLERVRVALRMNASSAPSSLRNAVTITITSTKGGTLFSGHVDGDSVTLAKVEPGDTYTVSASDVEGYATPQSITATAEYEGLSTITLDYTQTSWNIVVASNQQSDVSIGSQDVTMTYEYNSQTYTNTLNNGDTLGIPTGVIPTAVAEAETGYRATVTVDSVNHTITALYETEVLTISITKDSSLTDLDLTTLSVAVTNGQTALGTLTNASPTLKVAYGINYTLTPSTVQDGSAVADDGHQISFVGILVGFVWILLYLLAGERHTW